MPKTNKPKKQMTDEDYRKWSDLVHRVIQDRFSWTYNSRDTRGLRRAVGYDDLVQEGSIALFKAWQKHNPLRDGAASFKTYAYHAIYRRIARYVGSNLSPVTVKNWAKSYNDPKYRDKVTAAVGCILFSEVVEKSEDEWSSQIGDESSSVPVETMIHKDVVKRCFDLLEKNLSKRELGVLRDRHRGKTYAQIAKKRHTTREQVRRIYQEALVKAAIALTDMEEHYEDSRQDIEGKRQGMG